MKIRKIVYNIDYTHILTFNTEWRFAVAPYFSYEGIRYAVDNENTINERLRLVFPVENFVFNLRKEGFTFAYEGDITLVKRNNPIVNIFFDIYEKVKKFAGFTKTIRHRLVIDAVDLDENIKIDSVLREPRYLSNPFGKLEEFGVIFEFIKDQRKYKFDFGNYTEKDIKKYDLSPLNTEYNKDLKGSVGLMCQLEVDEILPNPSFSKFKLLLADGENIIKKYSEEVK